MTLERFAECLASLRWTTIDLTSALQCQLSWIEDMESGLMEIPEDWLSGLTSLLDAMRTPDSHALRGLERVRSTGFSCDLTIKTAS
jgi:hypothetical protein